MHGGFVEVSGDAVSILSDVAEAADQVDIDRAKAALEAARKAMADNPIDADAVVARRRAEVRLEVAGVVPD